jgi:hypothetical protein
MLVHVDKAPYIIMACYVLDNFCELHGILEPIVCDIKECNDPLIGFDKVNYLQKIEQAKHLVDC